MIAVGIFIITLGAALLYQGVKLLYETDKVFGLGVAVAMILMASVVIVHGLFYAC